MLFLLVLAALAVLAACLAAAESRKWLLARWPAPDDGCRLIKNYVKRHPALLGVYRRLQFLKYELADLRDSLSGAIPLVGIKSCETPYGFRLYGIATSIHHEAMCKGQFEPEETGLLQRALAVSDVFVDVGANIGYYVCLACHSGKHALAIEPQPKNLKLLRKNLLVNGYGDVEIITEGVADKPGTARLYGPSGTGASVIPGWAHQHAGYHFDISLTTLDAILNGRFPGKRLLVKMDVEGAEYPALKGAAATLARRPQPLWMVEICLEEYHPQGMNPDYLATFEKFWEHGYEARTADARQRLIAPDEVRAWVQAGRASSGVINYLFVPAGANKL
jgi:FkbM family methyltransferase